MRGMPLADWEPRQNAGQAVRRGRAPHLRTATPRIPESATEPGTTATSDIRRWLRGTRDRMRNASLCIVVRQAGSMTRAVTIRLDEADHAALAQQAEELRVRPGTLARMLVHAGLSGNAPTVGSENAREALDRLVRRSQMRAAADAVGLVADARAGLEPHR